MYARHSMPFGKYKGERFDNIPEDYFNWLLDQDWLSSRLRAQIEDYLESGGDFSDHESYQTPPYRPAMGLTAEETSDLQKIINLGFRALALKYHPDVGGNPEDMKRLNNLVAKLRAGGLF